MSLQPCRMPITEPSRIHIAAGWFSVESDAGLAGGSSEVAFEWKSTDGRPPTAKDLQELMEKEKASSGIF